VGPQITRKKPPPDDLVAAVVDRIQKIRETSELRELWAETEHLTEWVATLDELVTRLRQPPRPLDTPLPRRPPVIENHDGSRKWKIAEALLSDPQTPDWLTVRLVQDFEPAELAILEEFVERHPETAFCLTDHPSRKSFKLAPDILRIFRTARHIDVWISRLSTLTPFAEYSQLETLRVRNVGKVTSLLRPLTGLQTLKHLVLHDLDRVLVSSEQDEFRTWVCTRIHSSASISPPMSAALQLLGCEAPTLADSARSLRRWAPSLRGVLLYELPLDALDDTLAGLDRLEFAAILKVVGAGDSVSLPRLPALRCLTIDNLPRRPLTFDLPESIEELTVAYHFDVDNPLDAAPDLDSFEFLRRLPYLKHLSVDHDRARTDRIIERFELGPMDAGGGLWDGLRALEQSLQPAE
jgi:hypothetical protein